MIVKSKSQKNKSAGGRLLSYVTRENAIMRDKLGNPIIIKHNIKGSSLSDFEKAFLLNELNRLHPRKGQNYFYHEFIPFHPDDTKHLTAEILEDITRHYLLLRAPNGMGIAVFHEDKHLHAHIVLSAVEISSGRALRMTKEEFEKVKVDLQKYQLENYPELTASYIDFTKESAQLFTDEERQMKQRTGKATRKEEIQEVLQNAFEASFSPTEFYTKLGEEGLSLYERNGRIGIEDNRNYRLETLGYGEEKMQELDNREERLDELASLRESIERPADPSNARSKDEPHIEENTEQKEGEVEELE